MANSITDAQNSFITFNEQIFLSQRDCGIVRPFCLPIFEAGDLSFQFILNSDTSYSDLLTLLKFRTISSLGTHTFITGYTKNIEILSSGIYFVYVQLSGSTLLDSFNIGDCFNIELVITNDDGGISYSKEVIQCFQIIPDTCFSAKLTYYNNENAFDFYYTGFDFSPNNKVRLPITFRNPNVLNDQDVYVRSDGTRTKLYARLSKQYQGVTDYVTEEVHQKLVVALSHDNVTFVTDNDYSLTCTFENEYNPNYPDVMQGINVWPADFIVNETPFYEVNNNCA